MATPPGSILFRRIRAFGEVSSAPARYSAGPQTAADRSVAVPVLAPDLAAAAGGLDRARRPGGGAHLPLSPAGGPGGLPPPPRGGARARRRRAAPHPPRSSAHERVDPPPPPGGRVGVREFPRRVGVG